MNLKKSALSLAVAGALGATAYQPAVAGDVGAYGRIDVSLAYRDTGAEDDDVPGSGGGARWGLFGTNSRFGFKGSEDLGNGMSAIYRYEFRVYADQASIASSQRLSYVGLQGGFGTFSMGQQWSAYFNHVGTMLDPTYWVGSSTLTAYRRANTIKYAGGGGPVSFDVDLYMDLDGGNTDDLDGAAGALTLAFGPISIAGAYDTQQGGDVAEDINTLGLSLAWAIGKVATVRFGYEQRDDDNTGTEPLTNIQANVSGGFGGGWSYLASIGQNEDDDGLGSIWGNAAPDATKRQVFSGNITKKLSKRTRLYYELGYSSPDEGDSGFLNLFAIRHDY